jgi:hypothetical protein
MGMKISQQFQSMFARSMFARSMFARSVLVSAFVVAVPGVAAALPAAGSDAPVPLCGEDKADKGDSTQQDDKRSEKKDAKKTDKKQVKDEKNAGKGAV